MGTFAHDVAVGEEGLGLFVVILFAFFFEKLALFVELAEELGSVLAMGFARGAAVDVEGDSEVGKGLLDEAVVTVYHFLHRATFLAGTDGHGHAVFVRATNEEYLVAFETEVSGIDIGGNIDPSKVSNVHTAVGVRQCGGDEGAVKFLVAHICVLVSFDGKVTDFSPKWVSL